ncbi:MAG: hypothetical protein AAF310_01905 [Myxococcota bacterium]
MQKQTIYVWTVAVGMLALWGCGDGDTTTGASAELASAQINPMLAVSSTSACALKASGKPTCKGQVSAGSTFGKTYSYIAVSDDAFCGLRTGGTFTSAGSITCNGNKAVQSGKPSSKGFASIFAGKRHFCAVKPDNTFVCWGPTCQNEQSCWYNQSSNLTQGSSWTRFPGDRFTSTQIRNIAAGDDLTCYEQAGSINTVECFGNVARDGKISLNQVTRANELFVGSSYFCLTSLTFINSASASDQQCYDTQTLQLSSQKEAIFENIINNFSQLLTTDSFSLISDVSYNGNLYCYMDNAAKQVTCGGASTQQNSKLQMWQP